MFWIVCLYVLSQPLIKILYILHNLIAHLTMQSQKMYILYKFQCVLWSKVTNKLGFIHSTGRYKMWSGSTSNGARKVASPLSTEAQSGQTACGTHWQYWSHLESNFEVKCLINLTTKYFQTQKKSVVSSRVNMVQFTFPPLGVANSYTIVAFAIFADLQPSLLWYLLWYRVMNLKTAVGDFFLFTIIPLQYQRRVKTQKMHKMRVRWLEHDDLVALEGKESTV